MPFWDRLDAIGVSLYPPLGADGDRDCRRATMRAVAERLDALAMRDRKPSWSARSACAPPLAPRQNPGKAPRSAPARPIRRCKPTCSPTGLRFSTGRRSAAS